MKLAKCLECERWADYRGLCSTHYRWLQAKVRRGETSWEVEEKAGRCDKQKRGKDGQTPQSRKRWKEQLGI
jgi:hypothetical protein